MSSRRSSGRVAGRVALENGVPSPLLPDPTNLQWDEIKPLSGKPYYHTVLSASNVWPRYLMIPRKNLREQLPSNEVPTILNYRGKSWDIVLHGQRKQKAFGAAGWKKFAVDNSLRAGDACIFELLESSDERVRLEVQILRGDIPSEYLRNEMITGHSLEMPIVLN